MSRGNPKQSHYQGVCITSATVTDGSRVRVSVYQMVERTGKADDSCPFRQILTQLNAYHPVNALSQLYLLCMHHPSTVHHPGWSCFISHQTVVL